MEYKCVREMEDAALTACANAAFSDYPIPIHFTENTLRAFFAASGVERDLSFCACEAGEAIGFIFNAAGHYNGGPVAFDAGTGVVPGQRGRGVFTGLYAFAEAELRKRGIRKYCLEVLQQNQRAVKLYRRMGFSVAREFSVLRCTAPVQSGGESGIQLVPYAEFDAGENGRLKRVRPSFEHEDGRLRQWPERYKVAFLRSGDDVSAFCAFTAESGGIVQLGYTQPGDLQRLARFVASRYETATAKNIDLACGEVIEALSAAGFVEVARQYEMAKTLSGQEP